MRTSVTISILLLSASIGSAQIAGAQEAKRLFFEADMVRHALEGQAGPFCVLANQFKRKEAVAWRIRVLDQTGQEMDDNSRAWSSNCPMARNSTQNSADTRRAVRPPISFGHCIG